MPDDGIQDRNVVQKIMEEVVKVVHVEVDTFNRWWEFKWGEARCSFVVSVCARKPRRVHMCCDSRSLLSLL